MSLNKLKIVGLVLSIALFGQPTINASSDKITKQVNTMDTVKHYGRLTSHYVTYGLAGAGALLGAYVFWNNMNEHLFLHTQETTAVAVVGGVAGLGLGYLSRGNVSALEQAELDKKALDTAQRELTSLRPVLDQTREERDSAQSMQVQSYESLTLAQKNAQILQNLLEQARASEAQARLEAQSTAASLRDIKNAGKQIQEDLEQAQRNEAAIRADLEKIREAGNALDQKSLMGLCIGLTVLEGQHDTLATLTESLLDNNPRKSTNVITINKMATTLAAARELEKRGILPQINIMALKGLLDQ